MFELQEALSGDNSHVVIKKIYRMFEQGTYDDAGRCQLNKNISDYIAKLLRIHENYCISIWYIHWNKCQHRAYFGRMDRYQSLHAQLVLVGCHVGDDVMTFYEEFLRITPYLDSYLVIKADEWCYTEPTTKQLSDREHPVQESYDDLARMMERTLQTGHTSIPSDDLPHTLHTTIIEYVQTLVRACP